MLAKPARLVKPAKIAKSASTAMQVNLIFVCDIGNDISTKSECLGEIISI